MTQTIDRAKGSAPVIAQPSYHVAAAVVCVCAHVLFNSARRDCISVVVMQKVTVVSDTYM